jgi:hypothetical protein
MGMLVDKCYLTHEPSLTPPQQPLSADPVLNHTPASYAPPQTPESPQTPSSTLALLRTSTKPALLVRRSGREGAATDLVEL